MKSRLMLHSELCDDIHRLYVDKNTDYGDSFQKVRAKIPNAILVRLNDKLNRLESLMEKDEEERKVKSESIDDTLMDIANYALLELVERRWDEQIDDEEDEEVEEDDRLTIAESIKHLSRRLTDMANMSVRFNTFHNPNYAHYEVFGSVRCNSNLLITVVRFDDNGEITGFKQEYRRICFDGISVDISTDLVTDPKMLSDNKIAYHTIRNSVWNVMDQKHFQWIITPIDGLNFKFHSYVFDENNDLVKSHVNYHVAIDINRPIFIRDVKGMFEKEDEDVEKN